MDRISFTEGIEAVTAAQVASLTIYDMSSIIENQEKHPPHVGCNLTSDFPPVFSQNILANLTLLFPSGLLPSG